VDRLDFFSEVTEPSSSSPPAGFGLVDRLDFFSEVTEPSSSSPAAGFGRKLRNGAFADRLPISLTLALRDGTFLDLKRDSVALGEISAVAVDGDSVEISSLSCAFDGFGRPTDDLDESFRLLSSLSRECDDPDGLSVEPLSWCCECDFDLLNDGLEGLLLVGGEVGPSAENVLDAEEDADFVILGRELVPLLDFEA
jgi:hypothetical protein